MVYTDGIHLIADSLKELHQFAKNIGLHRCWFHNGKKQHYDLMIAPRSRELMLNRAKDRGAHYFKDSRSLIQIIDHLNDAIQNRYGSRNSPIESNRQTSCF